MDTITVNEYVKALVDRAKIAANLDEQHKYISGANSFFYENDYEQICEIADNVAKVLEEQNTKFFFSGDCHVIKFAYSFEWNDLFDLQSFIAKCSGENHYRGIVCIGLEISSNVLAPENKKQWRSLVGYLDYLSNNGVILFLCLDYHTGASSVDLVLAQSEIRDYLSVKNVRDYACNFHVSPEEIFIQTFFDSELAKELLTPEDEQLFTEYTSLQMMIDYIAEMTTSFCVTNKNMIKKLADELSRRALAKNATSKETFAKVLYEFDFDAWLDPYFRLRF